ncbi:MAG: GAF domain-containing protein [Flavobacteriales bacterium]|nr:GAF domain-containing protein [Flavobacteriales bacterium]
MYCLLAQQKRHTSHTASSTWPKKFNCININNPIKLKLGEGICGHIAETGIPEIVADTSTDYRYRVDDVRRLSELCVPILSNNKVIGIIDSEHPEKNFYTAQDLEILITIAAMASTKIDQTRTQELLTIHLNDLEGIIESKTSQLQKTVRELRSSYDKIQKSDLEKETLLKEIHHRVKNNLQIVSSLLSLHAGKSNNETEIEVFRDCQNRIQSMSAIHGQLYEKGNLAEIDAKKYIEEICHELHLSHGASKTITIKYDIEPLSFDIETSVPLGLILNELIANTLKHAFLDQIGAVEVGLKKKGNDVVFSIKDNGIGFDVMKKHDTLGIELIHTLTSQLDGRIDFFSGKSGTKCEIIFPVS